MRAAWRAPGSAYKRPIDHGPLIVGYDGDGRSRPRLHKEPRAGSSRTHGGKTGGTRASTTSARTKARAGSTTWSSPICPNAGCLFSFFFIFPQSTFSERRATPPPEPHPFEPAPRSRLRCRPSSRCARRWRARAERRVARAARAARARARALVRPAPARGDVAARRPRDGVVGGRSTPDPADGRFITEPGGARGARAAPRDRRAHARAQRV